MATEKQLAFPVVHVGKGQLAADRAVTRWLRARGLSPHFRPRQRHSTAYCKWLARDESHRVKQCYDTLVMQNFKCWQCRGPASIPRLMDLHHPLGYTNLGNEDPSELVAVHRGVCHRRAHEALARQRRTDACGCRAA
jgi:hypothetical protein